MPRAGGEADKLGNQYEAVWTVDAVVDVFLGKFRAITVEAFGSESEGVEFHLVTPDNKLQFHSAKRQKQGGDWSIAKLCEKHAKTGRSILGDLFEKRQKYPEAELRFVSATGANELRELSERAETPTDVAEFREAVSPKLQTEFDQRIMPLCRGDQEFALAALKSLEVIPRGHEDLTRTVERRIDELFYCKDGSPLRADDVRRMIADFILGNLGPKLDTDRIRGFFGSNGIGVRDWKTDATIHDAVERINKRYLDIAEAELINSAQISRNEVTQIDNAFSDPTSNGALLVAPGGFGKSCVLAQCLSRLSASGTPFLCLRMDSLQLCNTARQLGEQLDLPASPAVVLAGLADNAPSVLVIDQLDAMSLVSGRNPRMWEVFQDLCDEVRSYPNMKMVLACRDFDLNHDHRLRRLGDSESRFTKITLGKLSDEDIRNSLDAAGLEQLKPTGRQLEILGIPFHLLLFLQGDPSRSFTSVGELYDRYWQRKRQSLEQRLGREPRLHEVIERLTEKMSESQLLYAPESVLYGLEKDAEAMISEHILVEVQGQNQYRFFHESFFDYAYAKRFCASGRSVVEFLISTEQHLFRRAQVRQILAYRRQHDFSQYIADLREIFESAKVRFHINRMVASGLNQIDEPTQEEWQIAEGYLFDGDLSRYISGALRNHPGWFDLLDRLKVFEGWLASDDDRLIHAAIWFLEASDLHDTRSARIAGLIAPYIETSDDWRKRIMQIMSWGKAYKTDEMAALYLDLVRRGAYDEFESQIAGDSDIWSQHYNAEKEHPKFIIDFLATWFDRAVDQFDDGESWNFLDQCLQNHSRTGAQIIGEVAAGEPEYFVDQMLPRMVATILKTQVHRGNDVRNRAWPWLSNHADVFDIDDAVLLHVRKSLQWMAKNDVRLFRKHASTMVAHSDPTLAYLLLRSWADNPVEFANECAEYLVADQTRFDVGYVSWTGGGEGTGRCAITRTALKAISSHCSIELFEQLEAAIIGYRDTYENQCPGWRSLTELLLLRSLDRSRTSRKTELRIEELERKFPDLTDTIIEEDETSFATSIGSPIPQDKAELMTDDQWISAMQKYDGSTDRLRGGPVELSRSLTEFVRKDRERFASLVNKIPINVDPMYFSAILNGLCGWNANLGKEEKEADQKEFGATPTGLFLAAIDKLHTLPGRPCGSTIVGCIGSLSERQLPDRVLEIVSFYASNDPDPEADIWQDHGGDPYDRGINSARGQAAQAISSLLYDDHTRLDALRPALLALSEDPVISVRTCAINAFLPLLKFARDEAVDLFLTACDACEAIWATRPFDRFIRYAIYTHYDKLRGLLHSAIRSKTGAAVETASRRIILLNLEQPSETASRKAFLRRIYTPPIAFAWKTTCRLGFGEILCRFLPAGFNVELDASNIRKRTESMRKAAAGVYATNLSNEVVGDKCAEHLETFFNDESEAVRKQVSNAFFRLSGERLLQLKDFIGRYIESRCFENETNRFLHALEQSNVELPEIICRAAERILGFIGEEGTHIAYHGSMVAHSISTLVVRQYEQTTDDAVKSHCLDLIDRIERVGYLGLGDELSKIDR